MTAQSRAFETPNPPVRDPLMRGPAVAGIVRKDLHLLGPYAVAGAIWMFVMSALFHTGADFFALMARLGVSELGLNPILFGLFGVAPAIALAVFVILLAQTNGAADTRHDWLIRPVTPLELVAAKAAILGGVIVAPMIAGNIVYMMANAVPLAEAFALFPLILACCVLVLVLSWLVATPFHAVLALLGAFVLLAVSIALAEGLKLAAGAAVAGAGERADLTPFPDLDGNWIVSLAGGAGFCAAAGVTLWLLLARRRRVAALAVRRVSGGLGRPAEPSLRTDR